MKNYTTEQSAKVVDVSGLVLSGLSKDSILKSGDSIAPNTLLTLNDDSLITLVYENGTELLLEGNSSDDSITFQQLDDEGSDSSSIQDSGLGTATSDDLEDIDAIQALIESGEEIDVPDTAAGAPVANEGTGFVSIDRTGNELLAGAGYDTGEIAPTSFIPDNFNPLGFVNQPTITQSDVNSIEEGSLAIGNVLENDSDPDDTLSIQFFVIDGDTTNYLPGETAIVEDGTLVINSDGSYTFTPADDWTGELPDITYTTNTGASETLSITVTPISELIDADESVTTAEDTTINGSVLTNASSADGTPVVASFEINGDTYIAGETAVITEGSLTLNSDGSYSFVPADNFNGAVPAISYTVTDGVNTDTSTLSIEVTPVSDLIDADEVVTTAEDTTINGSVLTNASSADGTPVVASFEINGDTYVAGETAVITEGSLTLNSDGSYSFVPADNFNGVVPAISYTVTDGINTDTSTLSIEVTSVSDLVDADEVVTTAEDTTINGSVLTNASSADGTPVVASFEINGDTYVAGETAVITEGSLTLNSDGSYSFVPADNFNGAVPAISYTVTDGVNTDTSTLSIEVTPVSDLVDADEVVTTAEDTTINGSVLTNASSADGSPVIASFEINGDTYLAGETAVLTEGSLTLNSDGSYSFVPADNFNGAVPAISYTVTDGINTDTSTLSIEVTPVSDLVDADEVVTTAEDTTINGSVLTNASSADGTPVVASFEINGDTFVAGETAVLTEGSLTLNNDGSYSFVPADNFNGAVPAISYTVTDGVNTDTSTLSIEVTPVSDLVDADEVVITAEDTTINGSVLTNASSADGTPVVASFEINGDTYVAGETAVITEGSLTLNSDGSYSFVPAANFNGAVPAISYTVSDGVNTDTSTLSIEVTPVSDLVDADESVTTAEDTTINGSVLTNASSADGTPVVSTFEINGDTYVAGETAVITEGSITFNSDGSYSFVPADNFNGAVPAISYTVSDGVNTDTSTLSIEVTPVSDLVDADEVVTTAEDTTINGSVLTNASSADGTPVVSTFEINGDTYVAGETAVLTEGSLTLNSDGSYSFVPADNFNGAVPAISYTVTDGVNTDTSTLSIEVTPVSDLVDADEVVTTAEDTTINGSVLTNASSADGTPVVSTFEINGDIYVAGETAVITEGSLTLNSDGSYSFVPADNFNGAVPAISYTVSDGVNTDTSTLSIEVTPVSDLIDADEVVTTAEDTTINGSVLTNASSADGTPVVASFEINGDTYVAGETAVITEGSLTLNSDGSYSFVPADNFNGAVPAISYTVTDGVNTDTSTLSIEVTPVSDLVDADESVTTAEDTTINGSVLTNASSADGSPVIASFEINGDTFVAGETAVLTEGSLTLNNDGSYSFVPADNFNGAVPAISYTVSDGVNIDTSTLSIEVTPVSDLVDADEVVTTAEDTTINGSVLTNASSADGTPVVASFEINGDTYVAGETAVITEGSLTLNSDGSYSFVPADNFNGAVPAISYTVTDGVNTDTSTLSIEVTPVSDLVDADEVVTTAEDTTINGSVLTNASSADGTPVVSTFEINGDTYVAGETAVITEGSITLNSDGSYSFVPADNFNGAVPAISYTVTDGVNTNTSTLSIEVTPVSDLIDADEVVSTAEDTTINGSVLTNASSADGTPVIASFEINGDTFVAGETAVITEGSITLNSDGSYSFVPADNFNGAVPAISYTISDGINTDTSTLSIEVTPVSDLVDADESVTTAEDTTINGSVLTNASSADGTPVVASFEINGDTFVAGETAVITEGSLTLNSDGSYSFVPADNFNGTVPAISYTVTDGINTNTSTLSIEVTPVSDLVDADESVTTAEDTTINGSVLTNASSADGTPVIASFEINGDTFVAGETAVITEGSITLNSDGSYSFVPADNFNGAVPAISYTVTDGVNTDTSTLSIEVTPVSDLVDADESVTTAEDTTINGSVLTNASSADGTPVVSTFEINGDTFIAGETAVLTEGSITLNSDGSYSFVPADNFNGAVPAISYTVSDGINTDTSTLSIEVTPVSDLVDADEVVTTAEDTTINGSVLTNASSADGTPVVSTFEINGDTYVAGETAVLTEGSLTLNSDGSYSFVPADNFNGAVPAISYTVTDGINTDTSTLSIEVTPVSDLIDADEVVTTAEDTTINGSVLTNASSADGRPAIASFEINGDTYVAGETAVLTEGSLTLNSDGSYSFVPAANFNGAVPAISYTVTDGINTNTSTLSIEVTPVSDLVDADEVVTTAEDTTINGSVLTNASSADGSPVIASFEINGDTFVAGETAVLTEGSLTLNNDGSYSFVPADNFNGAVPAISYTVSDGVNIDTSTLSIEVTPVSDLVDADEVVTTAEDTTINGSVLTNASSADGTPVVSTFEINGDTYVAGETAVITEGSITLNSDGSYSFVPAANFNGAVPAISYTVSDGVNTDTSTLSIEVTPVSDLVDADEVVTTAEDTTINGSVLTNASSADGTPVVASFEINGDTYVAGETAVITEGSLTLNSDGSYSFVPADNFNGAVPAISYTVTDGVNTDTSTLSIEVTPVSDLVDADEVVTTAEDTTINGSVLTNASSADGTPVVSTFEINGDTFIAGETAVLTEGSITLNSDGSYSFVPADNFNGAVPAISYTVTDGVNTDTSILSIEVTPVSDLVDADEVVTTAEDTTINGSVLTNASSADGTPVVASFEINGDTYVAGETAVITEGSLTLNSDGSYSFVPADNFNGAVPAISYTVTDGVNTDTSTLSIEVTPVSDLIDADEVVTTAEDTTINGSVLTNASSADGTPVVASFEINGDTYVAGETAVITEGSLTLNSDGSYSFVPADNFNGAVPAISYTVTDGVNTDTSTLNIEVTPVSDLVDADEVVTTAEDTTINGSVLTNASSADGTPVVSTFEINGDTYVAGETAVITEGSITLNSDGSYSFVPADNFNGAVPAISYTVTDGINTDTSTLSIEVTPVSDLVDADESVTTAEDTTINGSVLTNASSADGTPVIASFEINGDTYVAGETAVITEGSFTLNSDGSYSFVPADNFNGAVPAISYTVTDGINTDTSTLSIEVTPVSDLVDADEVVTTAEDTTINGSVLTNASSADGTPVVSTFEINGDTFIAGETAVITEGSLTLNSDGSYSFVPADNFNGAVPAISYTVTDGVNTDTSTLSIEVTPVSDLVDADEYVTTAEDTTINGSVLTNASSADGTTVVSTFEINGDIYVAGETAVLTEGSFTLNSDGSYSFVPADNFNGAVPAISYTVTDGVNTDISTLTIEVTPVNDLPTAEDDSFTLSENSSVSGNVITHNDGDGLVDSDLVEGDDLYVTQVNGIDLNFDAVTGFATFTVIDGVLNAITAAEILLLDDSTFNGTTDNGILQINENGDFTYENKGFLEDSTAPSFTYTLSDGTDEATANVTINVETNSPIAVDDENYISLVEAFGSGLAFASAVRGNVVSKGSSGDGEDTSEDGFAPSILTQVMFGSDVYIFTDSTTSYSIATDYGTLTIDNTGEYQFSTPFGMPLPNEDLSLEFTYSIQDGDDINAEIDSAILTINIDTPSDDTVTTRSMSFSSFSETLDTEYTAESDSDSKTSSILSEDDDLSGILTETSSGALETYLDDTDKGAAEKSIVLEELSLESSSEEELSYTTVTNGLATDGGVIISDTAAPNSSSAAELDSSEFI
ncbi:tandem-95 repeat protein [Paraglaciecola sp. 2405UD69-4]|uniref:tandem-95 repeat protein n=1 Tax=Paraglaciecola sp. 2405UD69-4 TaxID=3391836 RepID=UPI0039C9BD98